MANKFHKMLSTLKTYVRSRPSLHIQYKYLKISLYKLSNLVISDTLYLKWQYKSKTKKTLNLHPPLSFNEKLQWLKINWKKEAYGIFADKYEVREHVENIIGKHILNDLYVVYEKVEDIDIKKLPESFVLKVNHGYGQNLIVTDKNSVDWENAFKLFRYYLNTNPYYFGREWAYKNITPRIICERYIEENGAPPKDYKFFCFNGKPKIIQLDFDRFRDHKRNMYDLEWHLLPFEITYSNDKAGTKKPASLHTMIEYATRLAAGFPFVRVDFYYVDHKILFGEMTFYPENALGQFRPDSYDTLLGTYLELPTN